MAPTRSDRKGNKKRRGRPPGSRRSEAATQSAQSSAAAKNKTRRKRSSEAEAEDELSGTTAGNVRTSRPKKRKSNTGQDEIADEVPKSRKKYVQLETKTRRIPQEQIDTWPQVSTQVLEQIMAVIRDAKNDIANTQRDERRVIAAHETLNPLVRKLARQLAASRIPPQAKDIHFNIDRLTERNAQISREVTTARHSKQLLSEQVKVAEALLRKDKTNLEQLKKHAKKWRTEWKHQEKHGRIHPLLQESEHSSIVNDGPEDIGLRQSAVPDTSPLDEPDGDLAPILEQLRRSLENMQSNHTQVEGIDGAISVAQAALDDVLFRHASTQQYTLL